MSGHYVTLELLNGVLTGTIQCEEPAGADCRAECPRGCEKTDGINRAADGNVGHYGADGERHRMFGSGICGISRFIEDDGVIDTHEGSDTIGRLPIRVRWTGSDYLWSVAPAVGGTS